MRIYAHNNTNIQRKMMITKTGWLGESLRLHNNGADAGLVSAHARDSCEPQRGGSPGLKSPPYRDGRSCLPDSVRRPGHLPHGCARPREASILFWQLSAFPCLKHGFSTILAKSRQIYQGYVQRSRQCGDHDHPRGRRVPQGQRVNDLPSAVGQKAASVQGRWVLAIQTYGHRQVDSQSI